MIVINEKISLNQRKIILMLALGILGSEINVSIKLI